MTGAPRLSHEAAVIAIVAAHFKRAPADVTAATRLGDDLRSDSLDAVELAMDLEEAFDLDIPEAAFSEWTTVGDLIAFVGQVRP
jgi:acyl carrier protein